MNAIEIEHFSKSYKGSVAVDDISFAVPQGEFFGFLGPNGAGKTTTINCLTGITGPTSGVLKLFGHDVVDDYRAARAQVGLSAQEFNVDFWAPVGRLLWYVAGFYGIPEKKRSARIDELLTIFDLKSHAKKPFRTLSGGLKRRVMIARAMIHNPPLLILDEPTAGVDIELRHDLWKYLRRINEEGKTILLTSHYLEEVELLCNHIAIIFGGTIIAIGDKSEFIQGGHTLEQKYLQLTKNQHE
ncbi:MAG: ABC transporter ATP-binding protein [Candidatus Magasanikbacteria bacterium]|nr:ABC transporter ATP-binding protein [Candidatus Magasanikbacteria bacterium]